MPLWSMTPTRFKFLPPKDLERQRFCERGGQGFTFPAGPATLGAMFPATLPKGWGQARGRGIWLPDPRQPADNCSLLLGTEAVHVEHRGAKWSFGKGMCVDRVLEEKNTHCAEVT